MFIKPVNVNTNLKQFTRKRTNGESEMENELDILFLEEYFRDYKRITNKRVKISQTKSAYNQVKIISCE